MKFVQMVPLPCKVNEECTLELPSDATILRMQLVAHASPIRRPNGSRSVDVALELRVFSDPSANTVPRHFALAELGAAIPDGAKHVATVVAMLPNGIPVNLDLFEISSQEKTNGSDHSRHRPVVLG